MAGKEVEIETDMEIFSFFFKKTKQRHTLDGNH